MRVILAAAAVLWPFATLAQEQAGPADSVVACRSITDDLARLACYDRAATALAEAQAKREIVIMDRPSIKKTRRSLFGFNVGKLPFMAEAQDESELDTTIASVRSLGYGKWAFSTAEAANWRTTEPLTSPLPPVSGQKVVIRRAALGSYFAKIAGHKMVRAVRVN